MFYINIYIVTLMSIPSLRKIDISDITQHELAMSIDMSTEDFRENFGDPHFKHPGDMGENLDFSPFSWNAPGPVELWCYEMPWGLHVIFERGQEPDKTCTFVHLSIMEIDAVLDFFELCNYQVTVHEEYLKVLREVRQKYFNGLGKYDLVQFDDNHTKVTTKTYESQRVAEYYRKVFEHRESKQTYNVEMRS